MASEQPQHPPTAVVLPRRPQLRHRVRAEQGRLALLLLAAIGGTILFGACCSPAWKMSPVAIPGIAMQFALIGLPWWWFLFRLTYYTFTVDLEKCLARYGPVSRVTDEIDTELRDARDVWLRGEETQFGVFIDRDFIVLTLHWLMQVRPRRAAVMRVEDVVWIYKRVVPRRVWVRSADYRIQLGCRLRDGSTLRLEWREGDLDDLVEELLERRPGLLAGWRGEHFDLDARGPESMAKAHDERAAEFVALPAEAQEAWLDESFARYEGAVQNVA